MKNLGAMQRAMVLRHMESAFIFTDCARWFTAGQLSVELGFEKQKMHRILNFLEAQGQVIKKKHFGYANEWRCLTETERDQRRA